MYYKYFIHTIGLFQYDGITGIFTIINLMMIYHTNKIKNQLHFVHNTTHPSVWYASQLHS